MKVLARVRPRSGWLAVFNDANPTNDLAGCKILGAFVTFVNERTERGEIPASDAAALVESAGDITYALGCG